MANRKNLDTGVGAILSQCSPEDQKLHPCSSHLQRGITIWGTGSLLRACYPAGVETLFAPVVKETPADKILQPACVVGAARCEIERFRFALGGIRIPSVTEKPVKTLGKIFDSSLKDSAAIKQTKCDLATWLTTIDKSGLPGKFKAWIYQHGVLPRILWPLLVYEVPITMVEALEKSISHFLRRWLGLPRSLSSIALYGHSTKLQLPFSGLMEEFKVTRTREVMMYRDSTDVRVATAGILVKTGRKWQAQEAITRAEARLRHKMLVGSVARGRAGLGSFPKPRYDQARGKEKRQLVQDEIRVEEEEDRYSRMVGMSKQGAWTRWEHAETRKITWTEMWRAEPLRIKFLIQSVYDVLPSPANLHTWGLADTPECKLCQRRGTLEHILSCCPKALGEGRYRWRHDQVLRSLADATCTAIQHSKTQAAPKQSISLVRSRCHTMYLLCVE
ncbi:uncharacterized protein [Paralichthys olivaceus]|uniref:uncharacterized protein n=1 Tax=Paralichthys olivaceus TaxID=8255 RepID=UPI0037505B16